MNLTAVIDISTFIWNENDYNSNKNEYYNLISLMPVIYEQIKNLKLPLLIRSELFESIMTEFPYSMAKEISYEFERLTLSFLSDTFDNWISYAENIDEEMMSIPNIVQSHYCHSVQIEVQSQIYHLFFNGTDHKFITYSHFFNNEKDLVLSKQNEETLLETLCFSSENEIIQFFEKFKIKFEHNPKHKNLLTFANGESISPFTCYYQQDGGTKAQRLLEEAYFHNGDYYNFDTENGVFVKFVLTNGLVYHGFDLSDSNNNVPNAVKKKIKKDGKIF